jgi:hypothetical protein
MAKSFETENAEYVDQMTRSDLSIPKRRALQLDAEGWITLVVFVLVGVGVLLATRGADGEVIAPDETAAAIAEMTVIASETSAKATEAELALTEAEIAWAELQAKRECALTHIQRIREGHETAAVPCDPDPDHVKRVRDSFRSAK